MPHSAKNRSGFTVALSPACGQVLGDVEADAARAHDRHRASDGDVVAQHLEVGDDLGMVDAFDLGDPGRHAGGQDHGVEASQPPAVRHRRAHPAGRRRPASSRALRK